MSGASSGASVQKTPRVNMGSKRKAETTPTGASPKRSTDGVGAGLQDSLTSLLDGQKALGERFCKLEAQLESVHALAESLASVKESYEDCRHRLEILEEKFEALIDRHCTDVEKRSQAASAGKDGYGGRSTAVRSKSLSGQQDDDDVWETVHRITRNEVQREARRDNVVVSGLAEMEDEDPEQIVGDLVPDCRRYILEAKRIGKKRNGAPRRLLVKFSPRGKAIIWAKKRDFQRDGQKVYVGHDLTPVEQEERRKNWPKYKKLREAGVTCSMPRCEIVQDGKVMDAAAIEDALRNHA